MRLDASALITTFTEFWFLLVQEEILRAQQASFADHELRARSLIA